MWTYEDLLKLTPEEFEHVLADLWRAMGYTVTVVGGPGDKGIDILAVKESGVPLTLGIQAKCYGPTNKVGVREIREYASVLAKREVDSVVVVCTSGFTEEALKEAKLLNVKTIDGKQLLSLLNQHHIPARFPASFMPSPQSFIINEKRVIPRPEKSNTGKQTLGHPGWALVLLIIGMGGFGALADSGFNAGMFILYLFCFIIGLGLGLDYLGKMQTVRQLQNALNLNKDEAQTLVIRGFDSIAKIAGTTPETLSSHIGVDLSKAYEIIRRAKTSPKLLEESIVRSPLVTLSDVQRMLTYVAKDEKPIGVLEGRWPLGNVFCILLFTDRRIIVVKAIKFDLLAIGTPRRPIDVQVISERYANITFEDLDNEKKHSVLKISRLHLEKVLEHYRSA